MIICKTCKIEMRCSQTGTVCLFSPTHGYPGDSFKCPTCNAEVISTNTVPYCYPKGSRSEKYIFKMDSFESSTEEQK